MVGPLAPVRVELEPGISLLLDPTDFVTRRILDAGLWEPATWNLLEDYLPSGGTFVDVGAHVGWFSLKAAKIVGPLGRVIAIEPNQAVLPMLRDNIRASQAQIELYAVACMDSESELEFYSAAGSNTGGSSILRQNVTKIGVVQVNRVCGRPLDDILEEAHVSRVDVIKIDVEGAELLTLKGAQRVLNGYGPIVIVETLEKRLRTMGISSSDIVEFLAALGYRLQMRVDDNSVFSKNQLAEPLPARNS